MVADPFELDRRRTLPVGLTVSTGWDRDEAYTFVEELFAKHQKPENARAWLYQIAHRVALDHLRRGRIVRFIPLVGETRNTAPSAEHLVMEARLSGELQRALERIPERQRSALLLAELHDMTGLELAAALGVSHVAARALLTRARESLRQALAAERKAELDAEALAEERAADKRDADHGRRWGGRS